MITIEEIARVDETRHITFPVPDSVAAGDYRMVVTLEAQPKVSQPRVTVEEDPVMEIAGAYFGPKEATGRNAEEILYGRDPQR